MLQPLRLAVTKRRGSGEKLGALLLPSRRATACKAVCQATCMHAVLASRRQGAASVHTTQLLHPMPAHARPVLESAIHAPQARTHNCRQADNEPVANAAVGKRRPRAGSEGGCKVAARGGSAGKEAKLRGASFNRTEQ